MTSGSTGLDLAAPYRTGPKATAAFGRLGIVTNGDLLRHYPRRYERRGELTPLAGLTVGEQVTVLAEVQKTAVRRTRAGKDMVTAYVTDGTGATLSLTHFHKATWWAKAYREGRVGLFAGEVGMYGKQRQLIHPAVQWLDSDDPDAAQEQILEFADALIPIYPSTKDLDSWNIAKAVRTLLDVLGDVEDPLPEDVRQRHDLLELGEAFHAIHRPAADEDWKAARTRFVFEEAFVLQAALAQRRYANAQLSAVPRESGPGGVLEAFDARLPWPLTEGQESIGAVIEHDLAQPHPMQRLLQGEVGSGKTVVALRAMLAVVDAGGQAALLAPTEVLAQQHHRSLTALLGPLAERGLLGGSDVGTRVALLTGSVSTGSRRQAMLEVVSGDAGIVVGTHALLEERVQFHDLGLVVVDEQHRFGVEQRAALAAKSDQPPHVLVMTATPIPRTVAMTVFGDLEVSTLTELPAGRQPITSHVVPEDRPAFLARAWDRIREEVAAGRQAYVVCPRIGGDEAEAATESEPEDDGADRRPPLAVADVLPELAHGPLAGLRVEALHGRMTPEAKDDVMRRFVSGDVDVLVATTVVEVGVDVANATVMVVLDADRFGVSQLHQLRGRVGRGDAPALCLFVTAAEEDTPARSRVTQVAATQDGFELSRLDLQTRREGDVLGASQSGRRSSLRLLSVLRDEEVIESARGDATAVIANDPALGESPALRAALDDLMAEERAEFLDKS